MLQKLQTIEDEIDRLCLHKRLGIEADYLKRIKCRKTLRCYVKLDVKRGCFLRLDSRVINDYKSGGEMRFSDAVRRFCVVFNSNLPSTAEIHDQGTDESNRCSTPQRIDPDNLFEWMADHGDTEAFEVKSSRTPNNIRLVFDLENPRQIYRLAPRLRSLLMRWTETRPNVLTHLWRYANKNGLASMDTDAVRCDEALKEAFGVDSFTFAELPGLVVPHLCPLDPLVVDIPVIDGYSEIFDIPFEWDDLYQYPSIYPPRIYALEKKIESLKQMLERCREKEKALAEFSSSPLAFINRWICIDSTETCHRSSFFCDRNVQESILELLQKME